MINWNIKKRSYQPIGVDIGHNSIKLVQLAENEGGITVVAADKIVIDPASNKDDETRKDFIVYALKQMLRRSGFKGCKVVSSLLPELLNITSLRLAETETAEMEQILKIEVEQRFALDPEKDSIDYMFAGNVRDGEETKSELILFATEDRVIKEHIDLLERANLSPVAIDIHPCALFRSFERSMRRQEDRERTVVFIDVGSRFTTVVLGSKGQISFVKQIAIGTDNFSEQIADKLDISSEEAVFLRKRLQSDKEPGDEDELPDWAGSEGSTGPESLDASTRQAIVDAVTSVAEELAMEVSLCLRYFTVTFRGKPIERAVMAGGGAYEKILPEVLQRQLAMEIEIAQPFKDFNIKSVDFGRDRRGSLCEWTVAVGLGLKSLSSEN